MKKTSNWTPKSQSGAKEGLDKKMNYWKNKDFQIEFGITVGQAFNLAYSESPKGVAGDGETIYPVEIDNVYKIFKSLLRAKLEDRFINTFKEYYDRKQEIGDTEEKVEKTPTLPIINLDG